LRNIDKQTVNSFGAEWTRFDQYGLNAEETRRIFDCYFHLFPWATLPQGSVGFDMGCGSGRWAALVAPRVGRLVCVDPSPGALNVARQALVEFNNVEFIEASANSFLFRPGSFDFGYSLGVLHHAPDTYAALAACVAALKPGAPFLLYLYYRFDNRPIWFYLIWRLSNYIRNIVCKLPDLVKTFLTDCIAISVYWPLARAANIIERLGFDATAIPLAFYRNLSFYTMRTDSRDRFGTPLEHRFTQKEIKSMMILVGLTDIEFSKKEPFWLAVGKKI
jgi:SAM-dependent methyltransferase